MTQKMSEQRWKKWVVSSSLSRLFPPQAQAPPRCLYCFQNNGPDNDVTAQYSFLALLPQPCSLQAAVLGRRVKRPLQVPAKRRLPGCLGRGPLPPLLLLLLLLEWLGFLPCSRLRADSCAKRKRTGLPFFSEPVSEVTAGTLVLTKGCFLVLVWLLGFLASTCLAGRRLNNFVTTADWGTIIFFLCSLV